MGYSWALSGRVTVKPDALADFRKATIDPARFDDWPDDWGRPGCDAGEMTVEETIDAYAEALAHAIEWKSDGVSLRAIFSNDSDLWLTYRSHLVAALRAAADFGGTSDVAITGYLDGGPDDVFRVVARADGTSELEVLTARKAKPVARKIYEDVQPLVDALAETARSTIARDPHIAPIHARVCAALREVPSADVMKAVKQEKDMFDAGGNRWKRFYELFDSAPAYIDALERGFAEVQPAKIATIALRILARAAPERGAELAKAYVDAKRATKALDVVRTEARAIVRPVAADPKKAAAAIAALKKIAPKSPSVHDRHKLASHPDVRKLCESKSRDVFAAARAKIDELTSGAKLARLKNEDHMFVYALALVLEAGARDEDWDVLFRIWSESPGFVLLDGGRIQSHGERGKKWIARYFGKTATNDYARHLQPPAAHALFTLDEKAAADALEKIVSKKRPSGDDEWAASNMIGLVREKKASPRWTKIFVAAATSHRGTTLAGEALGVLARWRAPKTAKLVLAEIGKALRLEEACELLERTGDASALPALRKHLKALGPKERGARNRVEQCIEALGR